MGVTVGGEVAAAAAPPPPGDAPIGALEELLREASTAVRGRGGAGLLVSIDELHAASADDLATLLNALQNLDGSRDDNPLTVVTAGLPVTPEAITRAATFGERSAFVPLDVLTDDDARQLLVEPAAALDVTWSPEALAAVLDRMGGHPYLLQLAGSSTWRARPPRSRRHHRRGGGPRRRPGRRGAARTGCYTARWGAATELERSFIVGAWPASATGNVTRARIAEAMGVDSRSISVPRERLIEKGIIEPVGHGLVRFTMPGFAAWVAAREQD